MSTGELPGSSGSRRGFRGRASGGSQDFDLNLASIIDCLSVLIAFIMVSTSFVSVGILDAGVAAGAAEAQPQDQPVKVTVTLLENRTFQVSMSGKQTRSQNILATGGVAGANQPDYTQLSRTLDGIKKEWPTLNGVTLVALNGVPYQDVVKSMETARKSVPTVFLGGF